MYSESEVAQSCLTLCNPVDCSPPGSSIHGIFQARVLEWISISFSITYVYMYIHSFFFFLISHFFLRKKWEGLLWWCRVCRLDTLIGELRSHMPPGQKAKRWNRSNIVKEMGEKSSMSFLPSQDQDVLAQCSLGDDFSRADSWVGKAEPEQQSVRLGSVGTSKCPWRQTPC